jgi:paraquat-inducible protein A
MKSVAAKQLLAREWRGMLPSPADRLSLARICRRHFALPLLIVASGVSLVMGLSLPLLYVEKMYFWEKRYSVAKGVFGLWDDGEHFLAGLVFFFSFIFPILKLVLLAWIWFVPMLTARRAEWLARLSALGKWSMLDVFIVAILVVASKLGAVADVRTEEGIYYFASAILGTMIACEWMRRLVEQAARAELEPPAREPTSAEDIRRAGL